MANQKDSQKSTVTPVLTDLVRGVDDPGGVPATVTFLLSAIASLSLRPGQMINGKISPTVSANDLILTLLTASGGTPSASDPVLININGTVRTVTAALSVTKADGTNWCNAGSAELATKEIDYFAYIGYNATDGVVIGFSRIPYANLYSDFSATTTNEKYAGISTIANAVAGDNYVNIGRFVATLSAGAGYTWTVPTFTATNLIQRSVYRSRLLSWAPAVTSGAGTPTTTTPTGSYIVDNETMLISAAIKVVDKGTASGALDFTTPFAFSSTDFAFSGVENYSTGALCIAYAQSGKIRMYKYDVTTLWVNTYNNVTSGILRI